MAKKKIAKKKPASTAGAAQIMMPPPSGVSIRMYRQGHGDCFLLAFRQEDGRPYYILIDCGMKKGSSLSCTMEEVAGNIRAATGGHLDLVVITHEHEDHVSGFLSEKEVFSDLSIDKLWLAWTEDPTEPLANQLRAKYKDVLLGLVAASDHLNGIASDSSDVRARRIVDSLLEFELSDRERSLAAAEPAKIKGRTNKEGVLVVKRRADKNKGVDYLRPKSPPQSLPNVPGVRVFVLGPPMNEASLQDMDPRDDEEFHLAATEERFFLAALSENPMEREVQQPFEPKRRIPHADARRHSSRFFDTRYFAAKSPEGDEQDWRRIDGDWLRSSEAFALRMSNYVNNTSLVLAFELPRSKKVLLFVGDAQRGNWVSWHDHEWNSTNGLSPGEKATASDLLGRTVFYKCGHHGSHNATMNKGGLREMAQGAFADDFVAMIPANEQWATTKNDPPWRHPLKEIHEALISKAKGRVFVMDRDLRQPPSSVISAADWQAFQKRTTTNDLFYEITVED